ncbi:MAG: MFS transporter [Armatimonadetes bacterium]|nr:MFS transporter [Armatimonadota bacterium]
MVVLVDMGERMAERFLPIYLIALGGGAISVGLLNGLDNLLSALYSFPGGYLADRIGVKRALIVFNLMAIAGFLIVVLFPVWPAVILGAILFLAWTSISQPATMSLIAKVLPQQKRTMGVSMHSLVRRIPMAIGPVLGGFFIRIWGERTGVRYAFVVAAAMGVVAIVLQHWLIDEAHAPPSNVGVGEGPERNPLNLIRGMSESLRSLLVADILIRFCEQIPYAFVVLWAMKSISNPVTALQFGVLTSIEMATAIAVYIPVAYLADRGTKKPYIVLTFVFFTLFPLVLLFCQSFPLLVLAFILRGLKEFGEPARKALIVDLAPEGQKAAMFGAYYLVRDIIVAIAAFGGAFLWQISPATNFLTAFAFGIIGTVWFAARGKAPTPADA